MVTMNTLTKLILLSMSLSLLVSCSATRQIPLIQERTIRQTDTICLSNVQYDSIYIYNNVYQNRSNDTILIRQHNVEYRYKLLRDTVERIKLEMVRDSIPYEVRVETIREVPRGRTWLDKLCYGCFGILILLLGFKIGKCLKPLL